VEGVAEVVFGHITDEHRRRARAALTNELDTDRAA